MDVLFKKRAEPRLRIVLLGLKDVSRLEVFKPDNTRLRVFLFSADIDQLILVLNYLDLGLFWSEKLDVKVSLVFIRYKDTH